MLTKAQRFNPRNQAQSGIALLETLIAVLIFSIGVLGIIGLLGISVKSTADAKYRADAAYLANQIISRMWVDWDPANNPTNDGQVRLNRLKANYEHNAAAAACTAEGASAPSAYGTMNTWHNEVTSTLPGTTGTTGSRQRLQVDTATVLGTAIVTVTVCWHGPQDRDAAGNDIYHNYVATAQIGG